uniref:5'-AMP-activated protein kinase subunit beta-1 n=1 Tax=Equus asinus TaxID=9793 RepID=A0A9L0IF05_EQUAS
GALLGPASLLSGLPAFPAVTEEEEEATRHSYKSGQVRGTKQSNERGFLEPCLSGSASFFRELFVHLIKLIPSPAQGKLTEGRTREQRAVCIWCCCLLGIQAASHNNFVAILDLPEGEHQYKFLVDGQWTHDPSEPIVTSQLGTVNNIIQVKKTDFEVFDALMVDSQKCSDVSELSSSPPGPYHQEPYVSKPEERFKAPPILPPHLLQVILNKDTGISCDPALLPEPNHVMLNHLYALSIKDGVMVLSATHRYKKKYVTTLLYKPI